MILDIEAEEAELPKTIALIRFSRSSPRKDLVHLTPLPRARFPSVTHHGGQVLGTREWLSAVDFPPMSDRQQMNDVLPQIESVDDSIITDARAETIRAAKRMMSV